MGSSGMYGMYPNQWTQPAVSYGQIGANGCTCGAYMSVIPPEPCPIHDPYRAYWRMKYLREFGPTGVSTTTNTDIPKYEPPVVEEDPIHFNVYADAGEKLACGTDPDEDHIRWARVKGWVTCKDCKQALR